MCQILMLLTKLSPGTGTSKFSGRVKYLKSSAFTCADSHLFLHDRIVFHIYKHIYIASPLLSTIGWQKCLYLICNFQCLSMEPIELKVSEITFAD